MTRPVDTRAALAAAQADIAAGKYKDALQHCKVALRADKSNTSTLILIGKAALGLEEFEQAELAYRRALESKPDLLSAWEGLALVHAAAGNTVGEVEANERLLQLTTEENTEGDRGARLRLAAAYSHLGEHDKAIQQMIQVLEGQSSASAERIDLLCRLADLMMSRDEASLAQEVSAKLEEHAAQPPPTKQQAAVGGAAKSDSTAAAIPKPPRRSISCLELDVLAAQAVDDAEKAEKGEVSLSAVLNEIAELAPPHLAYLPYREEHLRRALLRVFHAPPRTTERVQFRLAALRECISVICRGGACTPLPFEAAVWILEEEEEIKGGQVSVGGQEVGGTQALAGGVQAGAEGHIGAGRHATVAYAVENFSRRMLHQFPTNPTAQVLLALMLRRRYSHERKPVAQVERRSLERLLSNAMANDAHVDCTSGFKALAELQYENRNYQQAVDTSLRGLRWLQQRRDRGHEALTQVALALRLVLAKSLRRLGRLDEAERHFKALAGWVTEGEAAFAEMCGSAPTSIHQQALRGIALVALARGDSEAARAQYERILGKAALGRGPAEHWAHADYGWLLHQAGDQAGARFHLEKAVEVAGECGSGVTDSQLGEHHYRLGEVYWALKGRYRNDKQFAYTQFFEGAKVEGHAQGPALAGLGRYFEVMENRMDAAQRCYKKALALEPTLDLAGDGLCHQLVDQGRIDAAEALCKEIASRAPQAVWAWHRLGVLLLEKHEHAGAIANLQTALRAAPRNAATWEALGAAYQPQGRLTAALKAYGRALELEPNRVYSLVQSGTLNLALGNTLQALECHRWALTVQPGHPPALLGVADALTACASANIQDGALKAAWGELKQAAHYAEQCARQHRTLIAGWKQLGDVLLLQRHCCCAAGDEDPSGVEQSTATLKHVEVAMNDWRARIIATQGACRAYSKALHLHPAHPTAWHDVACSCYHQSKLRRMHPSMDTKLLGSEIQRVENRLVHAERLLRGALRLHPSSSELWASLGVAAASPATKEYALARSLQLDPRNVLAWVALARVYIAANEGVLAERCLQQARSQDPTVASIWEAMAALAALSPSGAAEQADFYEHAVGLDAGGEGLLGFAEAAMARGLGADGRVYTAARRVAMLQPFNPAAQNTLGLACEAHGDHDGAVRAYRAALEVLATFPVADPASTPTGLIHPSQCRSGAPLTTGVTLNLARALVSAGLYAEAIELYGELEFERALDEDSRAWLSYGVARAMVGDAQGAEYAVQMAMNVVSGKDGDDDVAHVFCAAVELLIRLQCHAGQPEKAVEVLDTHQQRLLAAKAPLSDVAGLWLLCITAAAVETKTKTKKLSSLESVQSVVVSAKAWAQHADYEDALFFAKLQACLGDALALQAGGKGWPQPSISRYCRAVHICPWNKELRLKLATAAIESSQGYASPALSILPSLTAVASGCDLPILDEGLHVGTMAVLAQSIEACKSRAVRLLREAMAGVHAYPYDAGLWYHAALLASQVATAIQGRHVVEKALALARHAMALATGCCGEDRKSRLLLCCSEALLQLEPSTAPTGQALHDAQAALELAPSEYLKAAAIRQIARCKWASGDFQAAEAAYRASIAMARSEQGEQPAAVLASLELASLLDVSGRKEEAVNVLAGEEHQVLNILSQKCSYRAEKLRYHGLLQHLSLRRSLILARLADFENAKQAADIATNAGNERTRALGLIAQGAACLQHALALPSSDNSKAALLNDARRLLTEAAEKGQDGAIVRALLAQLEHAGSMRKKWERIEVHAAKALRKAERPVRADLLLLLGQASKSTVLCAKAAHTEPWSVDAWAALKECNAKAA